MRESILHRLWASRRFNVVPLQTTRGESLQVLAAGKHNNNAGPDFLFARIRIKDTIWSGHVEIHVRASDWYSHAHHTDVAYNTVILHVVWEADTEVERNDGTVIPTLALCDFIDRSELGAESITLNSQQSNELVCHGLLSLIPVSLFQFWIEELFRQRLREKCLEVYSWLQRTNNDWEEVLFRALLKGFGLNLNGEAFLSLASAVPFRVVRKIRSDLTALESLFFGLSGLLDGVGESDSYPDLLIRKYNFLKNKHQLSTDACHLPRFFSLRPGSFPTIRLSQLAVLYHRQETLFDAIRKSRSLAEVRRLLHSRSSPYWDTHYTFGRAGKYRPKKTTSLFTDLLVLNAVIPVLLCYGEFTGRSFRRMALNWAREIKGERNRLTRLFKKEGLAVHNALESQALIQLYTKYCKKNKCLQCYCGNYLLYGKY